MMRKPRILTMSSANMDILHRLNAIPRAGETVIEGNDYSYQPGGKGANAAVAAARLGADSVFATRLGNDLNGRMLMKFYEDNGIDTRFIVSDPDEKTGLAVVMVEKNGQNRIVVYPGANKNMSPSDADDALSCLPDALFLQCEIAQDALIYATQRAKSKCIPVFVDAGPAVRDLPLEKLENVEIFSPNEIEAEAYTGIRPDTMQNCMKVALALQKRTRAKYIVLKLGERGAYVYDGKYYQFVAAYEVKAVDTTGCGDAFSAAMVLEYLRSGSISRAVEYANIVGAITVMRAGGAASVPTQKRVAEFIERNKLDFEL